MTENLEEIRINPAYTQFIRSEFENGAKKDGTPITRKSVVTTGSYLKKISQGFQSNSGILPSNCRYMEKLSNGGTLVVIEEPPAYRTISVNYSMENEIRRLEADEKIEEYGIDKNFYLNLSNAPFKFTLAFPYVVFIMLFDSYDSLNYGSVFLRNARMSGHGDYLLKMPMMNISDDQYICYGDKANDRKQSLNAAIEHTIMVFWSATFNSDYTYNYTAYKNVACVNTYIGWQALSQLDPMFIYNVEWIKMKDNIKSTIEMMKNHASTRSKGTIEYSELSRVFTQAADTGIDEKIKRTGRSRRTARLYYDIAQGIYLNSNFFLHVGDPIMWGKHVAHIDSFIGFIDSDQIRMIRFQLDNGKFITSRYNIKVKDYVLASAKKLRYKETGTMKNGVVISNDDIITMKFNGVTIYRKVHFIRKSIDGITEAKIGSSFFILENTEGEIFNVDTPKVGNIEVKKDIKFLLLNSRENSGTPFHCGSEVTYTGIDVSSTGKLKLQFQSTNDKYADTYNITTDENLYRRNKLYTMDECSLLPKIFRVGKRLVCIKSGRDLLDKQHAWSTPGGVVYNINYEHAGPTIHEVAQELLSSDGSRLHIESYDMNIDFKIGDKVVYSDWNNPVNMLIIRTITAFKIDRDSGNLEFVLSDKDGRLTQVPYIVGLRPGSSSNRSSVIHVGKIRRIKNTHGRVTSGTKIKATKGYIPYFPKKDINIIIGFIDDTGGDDPLVLCSNCCTLWYSDMMTNFAQISMKSKRWATLAHAPIDITKIKLQPGDIVNGKQSHNIKTGWLVIKDGNQIAPKVVSLKSQYHTDIYTIDAYLTTQLQLDCIPNPRISTKEQNTLSTVKSWPNYHGLFIESSISNIQFLDDGRSLLHVSDSHQ